MKKLFFILFISFSCALSAQDSTFFKGKSSRSFSKLSKSLESNKSDKEIAQDYEGVAKDFANKKEYAKAEDYLNRARKLYVKINDKEKLASVDREIARIQEAQNKITEAISSYKSAGLNASSSGAKSMNMNDANRLYYNDNPKKQKEYIQQNLDLMNSDGNRKEAVISYQQMAQNNIALDKKHDAIDNLQSALSEVEDEPKEVLKIKQEIANIYIADKQPERAVSINKELLSEAKKMNDPKVEIEQLQALSNSYFEAQDTEKGLASLQEAYQLAIAEGHTLDAKNSLELLVNEYRREKRTEKALDAYADFTDRLESLIKSDSTLMDTKLFQIQEKRLSQLEKEKTLKDELIKKQDVINYILVASIILILIFLLFIVKTLYSIKKKNKRIALQSLRREMNPHFIFNSLNSVNQFIVQNNELEANKYLSSYSKLMRNIMENSNKDFISLTTELEQLREYLDLEHMRFKDKFDYQIEVDENIDTDTVFIPNMLIQPQLENAIWHGLRYKEEKGVLKLIAKAEDNKLLVLVDDNGIGLTKSKELKTKHQQQHNSRGVTNTTERIELLNSLYGMNISIDIKEKNSGEQGVVVTLSFPLTSKPK